MNAEGIQFDPVGGWPAWLVLAALCMLFFAATAWRIAARLGWVRALPLTLLRALAVLGVLLLLLRPARREELPQDKKNQVVLAALDVSSSMDQPDVGYTKRLDAAVKLLQESGLNDPRFRLRLFSFDDDARSTTLDGLTALKADGADTRIHSSVLTMLQGVSKDEATHALLLFTDGHDFEMASATKTALAARGRGVPVYAIPFGAVGKVRDVSLRIANYQPYCYIKQKCRISAVARFTGCEHEFVTVQLLRDGKLVDSKQVATREEAEAPVEFTVIEPVAGQVEYELRALPVYRETETGNNSTITYVNVLDDKIRVLLVEGAPYWDTTFLQRSLMRNDKIDLDAVTQITPGKARRVRKSAGQETLTLPATREEFEAYDIVLLGSRVSDLLDEKQQAALIDYTREGGVVICTRGPAGLADAASVMLEPVVWEAGAAQTGEVEVLREGRGAAPFQIISAFHTDARSLPPLVSSWRVKESRTLAATLAQTRDALSNETSPAFIHRPVGKGQVFALGAGDLWQWAFRHDAAAREAVFDRLWDQIIGWLLAASDRVPGARHRLRTNTANLPLGEEIFLRLQFKQGVPPTAAPVIAIHSADDPVAHVTMTTTDDPLEFEARHVPSKPGRYRAEVTLADGSEQNARFMVFQENRERTEVAADRTYLKKLAESSGGRLIKAAQFKTFLDTLKISMLPGDKRYRSVSLWDRPWVLCLLVTLFALDWYLRRRWGLT